MTTRDDAEPVSSPRRLTVHGKLLVAPVARWVAIVLCAVFFGAIFFSTVKASFYNSLCCGDDAAMAMVAKNLVANGGYSVSLESNGNPGIFPFHADISSGPAVIFPAALMILVFGAQPWAPGLAVVVTCGVLFAGLLATVIRYAGIGKGALYVSTLLLLGLSVTSLHFEHWYALLGELPASLFGVVGVAVLTLTRRVPLIAILGGILLGLAPMSKLLGVIIPLSYISVEVALIGVAKLRGQAGWDSLRYLCFAVVGLLLPLSLFELYKLLSVGLSEYLAANQSLFAFVQNRSGVDSGNGIAVLFDRLSEFEKHFGFSLLIPVLVSAAAVTLSFLFGDQRHRRFVTVLCLASILLLSYWLLISPGWPRYAFIGLFLAAGVAATPLLLAKPRAAYAATVVAIVLMTPRPMQVLDRVTAAYSYDTLENDRVTNMRKVAELLANRPDVELVSGVWAHVVDLEYMMPTLDNFNRWDRVERYTSRNRWLVINDGMAKFWVVPDFDNWVRGCRKTIATMSPYRIVEC